LNITEEFEINEKALDGNSNNHITKVCGIANSFRVVFRVAENFGIDLTSAKEHPNKEL
jgi:hypothetical protein